MKLKTYNTKLAEEIERLKITKTKMAQNLTSSANKYLLDDLLDEFEINIENLENIQLPRTKETSNNKQYAI